MSNPFLNYDAGNNTTIKINNIKPNIYGTINIGISDIPNLESRLNGTGTSNVSKLDDFTDVSILETSNNQSFICTNGIFSNQTIDHVNLSNKGSNTHAQIDTFILSKNQATGLAGLD